MLILTWRDSAVSRQPGCPGGLDLDASGKPGCLGWLDLIASVPFALFVQGVPSAANAVGIDDDGASPLANLNRVLRVVRVFKAAGTRLVERHLATPASAEEKLLKAAKLPAAPSSTDGP